MDSFIWDLWYEEAINGRRHPIVKWDEIQQQIVRNGVPIPLYAERERTFRSFQTEAAGNAEIEMFDLAISMNERKLSCLQKNEELLCIRNCQGLIYENDCRRNNVPWL